MLRDIIENVKDEGDKEIVMAEMDQTLLERFLEFIFTDSTGG